MNNGQDARTTLYVILNDSEESQNAINKQDALTTLYVIPNDSEESQSSIAILSEL